MVPEYLHFNSSKIMKKKLNCLFSKGELCNLKYFNWYSCLSILILFFLGSTTANSQIELVKDINTKPGGCNPYNLIDVNETLYFIGNSGIYGNELWKSDGTEAGTVMVKDILDGSGSSNISFLTNVNGMLFFRASDQVHGSELWKSDGTEAGTVMVKDILSGVNSGTPA